MEVDRMRLLVTLKNLDTGCNFRVEGIENVKQNKDLIEVKFNVPQNRYFEPYLYSRAQYDLVSIEMYKD